MPGVVVAVSLLAICICIAYGAVRVGTWLIDYREREKTRVIRDAAFVAQVSAEVRRG
jgi:hypothetical protein